MKPDWMTKKSAPGIKLHEAQIGLGYTFEQPTLLQRALTHCSSTSVDGSDNATFAFLGDSVLRLAVDSVLLVDHPDMDPAELSQHKNALTIISSLADAAVKLDLLRFATLGRGLINQSEISKSVLANLYQAVCGAIFLDLGFDAARSFVKRTLKVAGPIKPISNPKTDLQIWTQAHLGGVTPRYKLLGKSGPDHQAVLEVCVYLKDKPYGKGSGPSKQEAEATAAAVTLKQLTGLICQPSLPQPLASTSVKPIAPITNPTLAKQVRLKSYNPTKKPTFARPIKSVPNEPAALLAVPAPAKRTRLQSYNREFGYCQICNSYADDIIKHWTEAHGGLPPEIQHYASPYSELPMPDVIANPYANDR